MVDKNVSWNGHTLVAMARGSTINIRYCAPPGPGRPPNPSDPSGQYVYSGLDRLWHPRQWFGSLDSRLQLALEREVYAHRPHVEKHPKVAAAISRLNGQF